LIGAVNGVAVTGGFEVALNCDFIIASDRARFADTHARVGVMPGWGLTVLLPQRIGVARAREMSVTGNFIDAQQAYEWGMVNKVCPDDQLMAEAMATARRIAENAPISVRQAKKAIDKATDLDRTTGYAFEIEAYNRTVGTEDRQEGINAFNEKRKPKYKGR
jgi:enoyl-CoA hydratase/carnithine racemase